MIKLSKDEAWSFLLHRGRGEGGGRDTVCLSSHRYTLIPTSILLGLGAAPLWSAHCTYLTIMGNTQAEKVGKVGRDVVNQYFGIFFLIFQSSGVWGNLISSLVFGQTPTQGKRARGSVKTPEGPPIPLTHVFIPPGQVNHPTWFSTAWAPPLLCPALLQDSLCSSEGRSCPQVPQPCWSCPPRGRGTLARQRPGKWRPLPVELGFTESSPSFQTKNRLNRLSH